MFQNVDYSLGYYKGIKCLSVEFQFFRSIKHRNKLPQNVKLDIENLKAKITLNLRTGIHNTVLIKIIEKIINK